MWKEVFGEEDDIARVPQGCYADEESPYSSRRVSTISNDSFDASCYVHVDSKLKTKMPQSLLDTNDTDKEITNHFEKLPDNVNNNDCTPQNGKRVIRKRLSISQFRASTRVKRNENNSNNNCNSSDKVQTKDSIETGTTDSNGNSRQNSTNANSTKREKQSTDVLSAKIQHLLFEMKRLRRLDRDILRKFLIINDSIEEQKWMIEEKQEAIKQNLTSEDADELVQSFVFPEERDDDEESIQSVLSRQNSGCGIYEDDPTTPITNSDSMKEQDEDVVVLSHPASTESDMTSSESVLSISEASSTLSSTTSVSTSQKSNSPVTSNLSGSSSICSSADSNEVVPESNGTTNHQQYLEENEDIEGYYRMNGSSAASKRGAYPYMARSYSTNTTTRAYHNGTYSDVPLDNGYEVERNSLNVQTKSTEYEYASRKDLVNRSYNGPYAHQSMYGHSSYAQSRPRSASAAYNDVHDIRHRVQRISVRPDGSHESVISGSGVLRRPLSATDKNSAVYRLLQHPLQKKHVRMNIRRHHSSTDNSMPSNYQNEQRINRLRHNWSFVPIAEQEPDVMYDNGRLISEDSDISSKHRREYQNLIDLSKQQQQSSRRIALSRQCPTPRRKASAAGSAGSLTSTSSRTSSSSLTSSGSSTSLHSPTKFMTNEADRHHHEPVSRNESSVWVQRKPSPQENEYIAVPYNKSFPAPFSVSKYYDSRCDGGAHNLPGPEYSSRSSAERLNPSYHYQTSRDNVPTVSYKPVNTSSKEAVYNWIQTQDDITYL